MDDRSRVEAIRSQPEYQNLLYLSRLLFLFPVAVAAVTFLASERTLAGAPGGWLLPVGGGFVLMWLLQMFAWLTMLTKIRNKLGFSPDPASTEDLTLFATDILRFGRRAS